MGVLDMFRLDDRIAIVTGGGRGLGRAMAVALAEAGAHVVIAEIAEDTGADAAAEIQRLGRRSLALATDVADYESVGSMVETVVREFGRVDILINNAGIVYRPEEEGGSASIPLERVSKDNWDNVLKVNLSGTFYCAQLAGRIMLEQGAGSIINIASMSAFVANLGRSNNAYCSSKAGVVMFTRQLAADWAEKGVRVNAIAPGYMKTEIGAGPLSEPLVKKMLETMTPMRRPGLPEDLRGTVVFLASDASAYLTGQALIVDGGYTLW